MLKNMMKKEYKKLRKKVYNKISIKIIYSNLKKRKR